MNYIQHYYGLPLAIVFKESKADYIQALRDTREKDEIEIFRSFMRKEYSRHLQTEIKKFEEMEEPKKGNGFTLVF